MRRDESHHQRALFKWASYVLQRYPELSVLHAIPNGACVAPTHRMRLVGEGLKRGVPDVCLPVPRGTFGSLYLELKSAKGRLSPDQIRMIELLTKYGNSCHVSHDVEESISIIEGYLNTKG